MTWSQTFLVQSIAISGGKVDGMIINHEILYTTSEVRVFQTAAGTSGDSVKQ
jgi:hypothetical protein